MAVQTFNPTDLSQSATNWAVAQRIVGPFAPHAQVVPNMTVALDPGFLLNGTTLTEVNAQSTAAISAPASGFRIDRVVIDRTTGAVSVVAGTANSMTPPAIPSGKLPVARVFLQSTTAEITNSIIVDERALTDLTPPISNAVACRVDLAAAQSISASTWTKINMANVLFDVGSSFDSVNKRFKPTVAGYYQVNTLLGFVNSASGASINVGISKNGTLTSSIGVFPAVTGTVFVSLSDIIYLNGTTDYMEIYGLHTNSGSRDANTGAWFSVARVA